MSRTFPKVVAALGVLTVLVAPARAEQDSVAAARDLYASAAYEDALAVLNRLSAGRPADEARAIEQYRAFCLLALGRTSEAERSIESVVAAEPMYRPTTDLSPRVRAAFSDVRKRVLPGIIQKKYAEAKALYDKKDFGPAAAAFAQVLDAMADPDVVTAASQSPLSDLRTLAVGFKDLATTAATPPPLPTAPPVPVAVQATVPSPPPPPKIYSNADADIVPPVALRQELPSYPGQVPIARQGMIEVLIDETGAVESAIMRISVSNSYDSLALAAAKNWRFRPAMLNGAPVKYRKAVQVTIRPTGPR